MTAIATVATAWDEYIDTWLDGRSQRTKPFERWYRSYGGAVTAEAMPEPWIGSFVRPRVVMLGLNPGEADLHFQGRAGLFADDIRRLGSFSRWATTDPYGPGPWEQRNGVNVYRRARLSFARRWTGDDSIEGRDLLVVELYPWHSKRVTATMSPPTDVLESYVWTPLAETRAPFVFAFGARWARICEKLGLAAEQRWGPGGKAFASEVPSRTVVVYPLNDRQSVVVSWQQGYAGPPGGPGVERLREILGKT